MGKRVTLKDIATAAGVTTATVSYVLNDTPGQKIAPETRERVLKAARELSYVPNSAASLAVRGRGGQEEPRRPALLADHPRYPEQARGYRL